MAIIIANGVMACGEITIIIVMKIMNNVMVNG
jgi:hypothetical protein